MSPNFTPESERRMKQSQNKGGGHLIIDTKLFFTTFLKEINMLTISTGKNEQVHVP